MNPVENVSLDDVLVFIEKLNQKTGKQYRLPNEVEWYWAATGGISNFRFAGTKDNPDDYAWFMKTSQNKTHEVGIKLQNNFGLYDMSGNVYELCTKWKKKSTNAMVYGGCIFDDNISLWASSNEYPPNDLDKKKKVIGFRLAMSLEEPQK